MITYAQFVSDFPEFSDSNTFPQSSFNFYANFASLMLTDRWGPPAAAGQPSTLYDIGTELFIAHNLALSAMNQKAAAAGGVPGLSTGPVSAKSVGPVSISYATEAGLVEDAGHWNLTTYGVRFIAMSRMVGSAPTYVGPHGGSVGSGASAWPGPLSMMGWH